MSKTVTLVSPNGDKYETASAQEITRLKAQGYTEKKSAAKSGDTAK
jgi:hypothetical protein